MNLFTKFANDESGAVTVDWVVLTAAIVGIAIAVVTLIADGVETASNGIKWQFGKCFSCWLLVNLVYKISRMFFCTGAILSPRYFSLIMRPFND